MADPNEAVTRRQMIDPALARAGWDVNEPDQVGIEVSAIVQARASSIEQRQKEPTCV